MNRKFVAKPPFSSGSETPEGLLSPDHEVGFWREGFEEILASNLRSDRALALKSGLQGWEQNAQVTEREQSAILPKNRIVLQSTAGWLTKQGVK